MSSQKFTPDEALKPFVKAMDTLCYQHGYESVFQDILQFHLCYYGRGNYKEEIAQIMKTYQTEKERKQFETCYKELIYSYDRYFSKPVIEPEDFSEFTGEKWFDPLGQFYEYIVSRSKSSALGQFFTPASVANIIAMNNIDKSQTPGKFISDCCAGSGRLLLAANAQQYGNFYFAEDVDYLCCLMTAVNMMVHGMQGEVVWHNSLDPDTFYRGWYINADLYLTGMPSILPIQKKEDAYVWKMWNTHRINQQQIK